MPTRRDSFERVRRIGLALPGVEPATKYDGSPVLKAAGCFMAGLATHRSAEPATLVVRFPIEDRGRLLEDAPKIYYVTDYYVRYPLVLARLSRLGDDALRDLLSVSRRMALAKGRGATARDVFVAKNPSGRPRSARNAPGSGVARS